MKAETKRETVTYACLFIPYKLITSFTTAFKFTWFIQAYLIAATISIFTFILVWKENESFLSPIITIIKGVSHHPQIKYNLLMEDANYYYIIWIFCLFYWKVVEHCKLLPPVRGKRQMFLVLLSLPSLQESLWRERFK